MGLFYGIAARVTRCAMDPLLRTSLVIVAAVAIKAILLAWWDNYKARKALAPIPMKKRRGVYVAWSPVQRLEKLGWRIVQIWAVYMAVLLLALAWVKLIGPINAWGLPLQ
jgi:hypothetical protein